MVLAVSDSALQLHYARVLRIIIEVDGVDLLAQLLHHAFLLSVLSLQLHTGFALFVQDCIFVLQNIHLQHGTDCVFFCTANCKLLPMVFQFTHHVIHNFLEIVQMTTHRKLLFVSISA